MFSVRAIVVAVLRRRPLATADDVATLNPDAVDEDIEDDLELDVVRPSAPE